MEINIEAVALESSIAVAKLAQNATVLAAEVRRLTQENEQLHKERNAARAEAQALSTSLAGRLNQQAVEALPP